MKPATLTEEEHDAEYALLASPDFACVARSLRDDPDYVKCPRCWHFHTVLENHDGLCDRCCRVLLDHWSDHPAVALISASLEAQRAKYGASACPAEATQKPLLNSRGSDHET